VRYSETPGGLVRQAYGVVAEDVTVAAKQLLDTSELERRSQYGSAPAPRRWPFEAAVAALTAESPAAWTVTTSDELAARVRRQNPLARWGVTPEVADAQIVRPASRG
jgi:hypothetical protein